MNNSKALLILEAKLISTVEYAKENIELGLSTDDEIKVAYHEGIKDMAEKALENIYENKITL
jgi:hypothetical protein